MADNASTPKRRYVVYMPDGTEALCYSFHLSEEAEVQDLIKEIRDDIDFKQALENQKVLLLKCGNLDMEPIGKTLYDCAIEWLRNDAVRKPMTPAHLLKRYFPDGPAPLDEEKIDIIVVTDAMRKKRQRVIQSGPSDELERLKRAKIATTAPSQIAQLSAYRVNQANSAQRILDDFPKPDLDIPPVALLYEGFGHFQDIYRGQKDVPGLEKVVAAQLEEAVDSFADEMAGDFPSENDRREKALKGLNNIFFARTCDMFPPVAASQIHSAISDGHITGKHDGISFIVELKNNVCQIKAMPVPEAIGFVTRTFIDASESRGDLFRGWRVPCLGLTIVGPYITFYAIILIGDQYRVVSLTPTLSCVRSACDGDDRKALYTAFTAASVLIARILADADKFKCNPPVNPHASKKFPYISTLPTFGHASDECIDFKIVGWYDDRQDYRLLYVAETTDKNIIMVKFTRRYSTELHEFCVTHNHAPKLLGIQELAGGWIVVAMEYILTASPILQSPNLDDHRERWMRELKELVDLFHSQGLVHGDLRDPNIICEGDKMMLIDFDWSGKDGEASYPTARLNPELMAGRISTDLKITKDDDERVLRTTLAKIRGSQLMEG